MHRVLFGNVGRTAAVLFGLSTFLSGAAASEGPPPILNPKTYASPSGEYVLKVDPSDLCGRYGGSHRVTRMGKELWSATLPFTLWDADISDAGLVGGFAYTLGWRGFGKSRDEKGPGDLVVVLIDPSGKFRLKQVVNRQESRSLHSPPYPLGRAVFVDEPNDRMVVRVDDDRREEAWWRYRLSSGEILDRPRPASHMRNEGALSILAARPVSGTPLTLVHWLIWRRQTGAAFTLVDPETQPVWTLELPGDYAVPGDAEASRKLQALVRDRGGILHSDGRGRFDVFLAAESKRVTFSVSPSDSGGWAVKEIARAPFSLLSPPKSQADEPRERSLKTLPPLVLAANPGTPSAIREVRDFVFDDQGRIAFLRQEGKDPPVLVWLDQTGAVLREVPLKIEGGSQEQRWGLCWVGKDRFVVTRSAYGKEGKSNGWWIAAGAGKVDAIPGFECPFVERLVGLPDGRFVAFAKLFQQYTILDSLTLFNAKGRPLWTIDSESSRKPQLLFSPTDCTVTTKGEIAVIDVIWKKIEFFDQTGQILREVKLAEAWGREPRYPARISADSDGGVIVDDSQGSPPFVRMKSDGTVRATLTPQFADGRKFQALGGVRTAPDGRLWACDGHSLLRLNERGVVEGILGSVPKANELQKIAGIALDTRGRIYAVDARTGSIHVFDSEGKFLHVCQAKPNDFSGEIWFPALTVDDRGHVYLGRGDRTELTDSRSYAHFAEDGKRFDNVLLPSRECCFQPRTGNVVAIQYEEVELIGPTGKKLRSICRGADGNWLASPQAVAVAPDGSLAISTGPFRRPHVTVNVYSSNGDPICTVTLPESAGSFPRIAFNGRRLVVAGDDGLRIFDGKGKLLQRAAVPMKVEKGMYYYPYLPPGTNQLALFDGENAVLHRYELP